MDLRSCDINQICAFLSIKARIFSTLEAFGGMEMDASCTAGKKSSEMSWL